MENKTILHLSLIFGNHKKFAISFDLRGVLNFRHLYYTQDSIAITFHKGTEITVSDARSERVIHRSTHLNKADIFVKPKK